jgi:hypothetical protein
MAAMTLLWYLIGCIAGVLVYMALLLAPLWTRGRISYERAYVVAAIYGTLFIMMQVTIALHLMGEC